MHSGRNSNTFKSGAIEKCLKSYLLQIIRQFHRGQISTRLEGVFIYHCYSRRYLQHHHQQQCRNLFHRWSSPCTTREGHQHHQWQESLCEVSFGSHSKPIKTERLLCSSARQPFCFAMTKTIFLKHEEKAKTPQRNFHTTSLFLKLLRASLKRTIRKTRETEDFIYKML